MNVTYKKEYLSTLCSNLLKSYRKKLQESEKNRQSNEKELSKMMEAESKSMMAAQEQYEQAQRPTNIQEELEQKQENEHRLWCQENRQQFVPSPVVSLSPLEFQPQRYHSHYSAIENSIEFAAASNSGLRCDALYEKIEKLKAIQSVLNDENSSDITLNENDIYLLKL